MKSTLNLKDKRRKHIEYLCELHVGLRTASIRSNSYLSHMVTKKTYNKRSKNT